MNNTTDILSQLDSVVNKGNGVSKQPETTVPYLQQKLKFSRNQRGYHWSYRVDKAKWGVSSKPFSELTKDQQAFLQQNGGNEAKFIIDKNTIVELWLKTADGEFIPLDVDILNYKAGRDVRANHGFSGFTFLPAQALNNKTMPSTKKATEDAKKPTEETMNSNVSFDDLKDLIAQAKQKFEKPVQPTTPSIQLAQKKENLMAFVKDFDAQIHKVFKDIPNREINISNDGFVTFTMLIEEKSQEDTDHQRIVQERNHRGSKLDTIDGEAMFAYLMNPIYEHLGFDRREDPDRKHYKGMGDSGDFKYGTTRLDIKTRKREPNRLCNLLVNMGHEDFNVYGLVLREGDGDCKGEQRRLSFVGTASQELVTSKPAQMINKNMKYEVGIHQLNSLRNFILDVLLEVLEKEES